MKDFSVELFKSIGMTAREFDVLHDVLWEIEESREYEGADRRALHGLQEIFSSQNNQIYSKALKDKTNE